MTTQTKILLTPAAAAQLEAELTAAVARHRAETRTPEDAIVTKQDWAMRFLSLGHRAQKAYYKAVEHLQAAAHLPSQKDKPTTKSAALRLAAQGLDAGDRRFGVATRWPGLANRLRKMADDRDAGDACRKALIEEQARIRARYEQAAKATPICACGLHPQNEDGYCPAQQTARETHHSEEA